MNVDHCVTFASRITKRPAVIRPSGTGQAKDRKMWQSSLDQFREHKSKTGSQHLGDLDRAINQLREILGIDQPSEITTVYLAELQAAVEAVGRAIKEERWAREGYTEFLGE
jgi:hypothetical protein